MTHRFVGVHCRNPHQSGDNSPGFPRKSLEQTFDAGKYLAVPWTLAFVLVVLSRCSNSSLVLCLQHLPPLIFALYGWLSRNSMEYSVYLLVCVFPIHVYMYIYYTIHESTEVCIEIKRMQREEVWHCLRLSSWEPCKLQLWAAKRVRLLINTV